MMRPLLLDDNLRAEIMRVVEFASKPANFYTVDRSSFVPGDIAGYRIELVGHKIVYSITVMPKGKIFYRHMSISVQPPNGKYPNQIAVYTIAHWMGFTGAVVADEVATGPGEDWMMIPDYKEECIVVAQRTGQ